MEYIVSSCGFWTSVWSSINLQLEFVGGKKRGHGFHGYVQKKPFGLPSTSDLLVNMGLINIYSL